MIQPMTREARLRANELAALMAPDVLLEAPEWRRIRDQLGKSLRENIGAALIVEDLATRDAADQVASYVVERIFKRLVEMEAHGAHAGQMGRA